MTSDPAVLTAPLQVGPMTLPNRVVMCPMTRARCPQEQADALTAEYYRQRAAAGLIVTEGCFVSPQARGYVDVPGIWTPAQRDSWSRVVDAVHDAGGRIFLQLWHVGRVSHVSLQPDGRPPVSSTARPARGDSRAYAIRPDGSRGFVEVSPPEAMSPDQIARTVDQFASAAGLADEAGFDGVELHGANGYLFEQFSNPLVNDRDDAYGGSLVNRLRFATEVVAAVSQVLGPGRLGMRVSPYATLFDQPVHDGVVELYLALAEAVAAHRPAYLHVSDHRPGGRRLDEAFLRALRSAVGVPLIVAGALDRHTAIDLLSREVVDLVGFGKPWIANPDLVHRLVADHELAVADPSVFYGGGAAGYTDFPSCRHD